MNVTFTRTAERRCQVSVGADTAGLVERAMEPFGPGGPSRDWEESGKQVDEVQERADSLWMSLADPFYEYQDDLTNLLRSYVSARRAQFPA